MKPVLAEQTLHRITTSLERDQGSAYRFHLGEILPTLTDAYNPQESSFRSHLGASLIGKECSRALWYDFRWFTVQRHSYNTVLLFNRGHLEEGRFLAILKAAGFYTTQLDQNGKQYRISDCGGHFGGSLDGMIWDLPENPGGKYSLVEFKTHGDKSFSELTKKGVVGAKPEHYIQQQIYMHKRQLDGSLYLAVNKNTDKIYAEFVPLNTEVALQHIDKAFKIIFSKEPPPKIRNNPSYFQCNYCSHVGVCHYNQIENVPRNCRTCVNSDPYDGGLWYCSHHAKVISTEEQLSGCRNHNLRT